uniref:Uncharacterized protein n=1 Tax=Mus musculus TaxID=10090 RepID=Q3TX49_MOUSE|nr:unnamed protein product [Mus musculus]
MHEATAEVHSQGTLFSLKLLAGTHMPWSLFPYPRGKNTVFLFYLEMI